MGVQHTGLRVAIGMALMALAAPALAQTKKAAQTDSELIASAMAAATKAVAESATIVAISEDGSMKTLRKGTNGFTCMPDNPVTPGPDPMCLRFECDGMGSRLDDTRVAARQGWLRVHAGRRI